METPTKSHTPTNFFWLCPCRVLQVPMKENETKKKPCERRSGEVWYCGDLLHLETEGRGKEGSWDSSHTTATPQTATRDSQSRCQSTTSSRQDTHTNDNSKQFLTSL